ncbi:MAG: DegT/DnrJ/EryC1/StrS family aminotransferase [Chryseolinea sp.]
MRPHPIPFYSLDFQHGQVHQEVTKTLTAVFEKNWYILGDELLHFETEYARFHGLDYCLGVGNGYDALCLSVRACKLAKGDEIIVPANTYIATWLAISNTGCVIVPVEPDPFTHTLDARLIEEHISPKTRAIMPVHLYGNPCDMSAIMEIANKHNLLVIEDNAQSHGAAWNGKITGSFGAISATSFYPSKNLGGLGDGGAITTSDPALAERVRQLRNYGFSKKNVCDESGVNSRLDEMQAAVLRIKLRQLQGWNERRRNIAARYFELLARVGDINLPRAVEQATHVYHLFVITTQRRDTLSKHLKAGGVETLIHYPLPPHLQKAYSDLGYKEGAFPVTEALAKNCLSLPLWPGMTNEQVEYVAEEVKRFYL